MFSHKIIKAILLVLMIALVVIQFIRPEKNNSGYDNVALFENETKPSLQVATILRENCYDCHSDQTQYPWYAEIAPFSFFLNDHIIDGKKHFNVSAWQSYSIKKKEHKLEEVVDVIENNEMPVWSYTLLHGGIAEDDKKLLLQWAGLARLQYKHQLEVSLK